jgi:hypothetical protein
VIVTEENAAPQLAAIADASVHYGTPWTTPAVATDADLPANQLTLSLESAPQGLALSPEGRIEWTPQQAQIGSHTVTVRVEDDGSLALTASWSFTVTVYGEGSRLAIVPVAGRLMQIGSSGEVGLDYELQSSADLVNWEKLVEFRLSTPSHRYIDPASITESARFYRLLLRTP